MPTPAAPDAEPALSTGSGSRAGTALALALIALGCGLRVQGIASHPLWIDEHGTWWAVAGSGLPELWHRVVSVHGQSPLYYLLVDASVALAGATPLGLRLPSLLFGIGLLLLAGPLARATLGERARLPALAAFALNERLIFYSQEARPYALALFCSGLSILAWLALLRDPRSLRARAAWLLSTTACFYAHYLFGLLIAVQGAHAVVRQALRRRRGDARPAKLRSLLASALALGLLWLPAAPQLADVFARRAALDWIRAPEPPLELLDDYFDLPVLLATAVASLLAAGLARGASLAGRRSGTALVALWLVVPFAAIALIPPLFGVTLVNRRYVAVALPAVPLAYGLLMALPRRARAVGLPLAVFLLASAGLSLMPRYQKAGLFSERYWFEPWSRAGSMLAGRHQPGEPIFYATDFVELDEVVRGRASEEERAFSAWPVAAYLPEERRGWLRPLPYGEAPELESVYRERLDEAAAARTSWAIGKPPAIEHFVRLAGRDPRIRIVGQRRLGRVYLFQLRGRSPPSPEPPPDVSDAR